MRFWQLLLEFIKSMLGLDAQTASVAMASAVPVIGNMALDGPPSRIRRHVYGRACRNNSRDEMRRMQRIRRARGQDRRTGA